MPSAVLHSSHDLFCASAEGLAPFHVQGCHGFGYDTRGVAAIEFALVAPVLLMLVFGVYAASMMTATINGLEQITAGAARSSVSGLSDTERAALATAYVSANAPIYPYIDPTALQVSTTANATAKSFTVSVAYDMSTNKIYQIVKSLVPIVPQVVRRQAVVLEGGS